ncbi:MAG: AraC family transcriptional regulator [Clostridia bacterium]|nr:AraC family transcriptional regulator [Clostridia bacterium]
MTDYDFYNEKWYKEKHKAEITAYYYKDWNGYQMQSHFHEAIEIMYVIKGESRIICRDDDLKLKTGDFIFINSSIPHHINMHKQEQCRMINLEFIFNKCQQDYPCLGESLGKEFLRSKLFTDKKAYILLHDSENIFTDILSLICELKSYDRYEPIVMLNFAVLMLKLQRQYEKVFNIKHNSIIYINKAKEFIARNYEKDIKIIDIAAESGIHLSYLQRLFKKHENSTITEYINKTRIEKATFLLTTTDLRLSDICLYVGINSRQYFSNLFKKTHNISPGEYRKNISKPDKIS